MSIEEREQQTVSAPALGETGEPCLDCGAPLAHDQRYCLNCGRRRADARLPFMDVIQERLTRIRQAESAVGGGTTSLASAPRQPLLLLAAGALFALVLGLGVLIGSIAGDDGGNPVAAAPPVVNVTAPVAGATVAAPEFASDWPEGQDGFTVQLETLSKDGSDVAAVDAAKQDAESSGASDVGALDSDDYSGMDAGNYVIYAGVFDSRKQAKRGLKKLKKDFPDASVVKVSAGGGGVASGGDPDALSGKKKEASVGKEQLKDLQKTSPGDYQKKSSKLPDTTKLPGKAPRKDSKKPGGGSGDGEVIE